LVGNGLLTSEGEVWKRQRRLAQPAFHRQRISAYGDVMVDYAQRMIAMWRAGEVRDIHRDMMRLTLEIVVRTLFNADVSQDADKVGRGLFGGRLLWAGKLERPSAEQSQRQDSNPPDSRSVSHKPRRLANPERGRCGISHIAHRRHDSLEDPLSPKERRPTAARGWAPEARLLARACREGSRHERTTSSARRGALPMKSDVDRFWVRNMQVPPRFQPAHRKKINGP